MKTSISCIAQRYSEANKERRECYDKNKLPKFKIYKDVNNLD